MMKLTTNIVIARGIKAHDGFYSYDKFVYNGLRVKSIVTCPKHGDFLQTPNGHLGGHKCFKCKADKERKTKGQFIKDAQAIHNDKYDYTYFNYINNKVKSKIICQIHGEFEQAAGDHLKGSGCNKCGINKTKKTLSTFISEANEIHSYKYNYSKINYNNALTKVIIGCDKHGDFLQKPSEHLNGSGCCKCGSESGGRKQRLTKHEFVKRSKKVHGNLYNYDSVDYVNCNTKVKIKCNKHGYFMKAPESHYAGYGCQRCNVYITEEKCRNVIETLTNAVFDKSRPKWLGRQHLDGYNSNLKIAFEYDGEQHYKFIRHWHKNLKGFNTQIERDKRKNRLCKENNVFLIRIPFYIKDISEYIEKELNKKV